MKKRPVADEKRRDCSFAMARPKGSWKVNKSTNQMAPDIPLFHFNNLINLGPRASTHEHKIPCRREIAMSDHDDCIVCAVASTVTCVKSERMPNFFIRVLHRWKTDTKLNDTLMEQMEKRVIGMLLKNAHFSFIWIKRLKIWSTNWSSIKI